MSYRAAPGPARPSCRRPTLARLALGALALGALGAGPAQARVVTISEALTSTRDNNVTWRSLAEYIVMADQGTRIGLGIMLPKLQVQGTWTHIGDQHLPDFSGFSTMGELLGLMAGIIITEHPQYAPQFLPYLDQGGGDSGSSFEAFIPKADSFAATFTVMVPVLAPEAWWGYTAADARAQAALQSVAHGREQLLWAVTKAYYGIATMESMVAVTGASLGAARQHFATKSVKASLAAATQLEVKRSELEVSRVESQQVDLTANIEKAKAGFRYLTGLEGELELTQPELALPEQGKPLDHWLALAREQRKDLAAARLELAAADDEVDSAVAKYLPTLSVFAQGKADNNASQRFDDDPWSWAAGGTLSLNLWDGGIREGQIELARAKWRQAKLKVSDLELKIKSEVATAYQALKDAAAQRRLAEHQLEVARATKQIATIAEEQGAATTLEVIDTNTMVFASEASALGARLGEAMAILDLLAACGSPNPFSAEPTVAP